MFRALTKDGNRISSLSGNIKELQERSRAKQLICPYCREDLQFVRSTHKRPYFRHLAECTYVYHDAESEEHEHGKELLHARLQELYPHYQVTYEVRVIETNQIADVMVIHPDGTRWAFEFQCYLLSDTEWKTRHGLYEKAGIIDFWVFGDIAVHNYSTDKAYHKLKIMEKAVAESDSPLYYLNTETEKLLIVDEGYYYSENLLKALESEDDFSKAFIKDYQWFTPARIELLEARRLEQERLAEQQRLAEIERQRLRSAWERRQKVAAIDKQQRLTELIVQRNDFMAEFTPKEKKLFRKLTQKHGFKTNSFPGILHLDVKDFDLIKTPVQLWQLWIYDEHIYNRIKSKAKAQFINARIILDKFKKLIKSGDFRTEYNPSDRYNFTFAIYDYLKVLCHLGILERMGYQQAVKYRVLVNNIPIYNDRTINIQHKIEIEDTLSKETHFNNDFSEWHFEDDDNLSQLFVDIHNLQAEASTIISQTEDKKMSSPPLLTSESIEERRIDHERVEKAKRDILMKAKVEELEKEDPYNIVELAREKHIRDEEIRKRLALEKEEREQKILAAKKERELANKQSHEDMLNRRANDIRFKLSRREGLFDGLTEKEAELFSRLCEKHGFTEDSYPGIFDVEVETKLIITPNRVWQLWLYDRCIYKKVESELFFITALHDRSIKCIYDFLTLKDRGVFRTSDNDEYRYAFYEYAKILQDWGIISPVEIRYYKIIINEIPIQEDNIRLLSPLKEEAKATT